MSSGVIGRGTRQPLGVVDLEPGVSYREVIRETIKLTNHNRRFVLTLKNYSSLLKNKVGTPIYL